MKVIVNKQELDFDGATLLELAQHLSLPDKGVAVAVGNAIVRRDDWASFVLTEGCSVTIIKAACGG